MGNLILPHSLTRSLPFSVTAQLSELPEEAQKEFFDEYNRNSKSLTVSYLLQFFGGFHYIYMGKVGLQILFWLSQLVGIGALWWVIDLFRMPTMIAENNNKMAEETLRSIMLKYRFYNQNANRQTGNPHEKIKVYKEAFRINNNQPQRPRDLGITYDALNLTVENLRNGYILDYDLKSWEVIASVQIDWDNGPS